MEPKLMTRQEIWDLFGPTAACTSPRLWQVCVSGKMIVSNDRDYCVSVARQFDRVEKAKQHFADDIERTRQA